MAFFFYPQRMEFFAVIFKFLRSMFILLEGRTKEQAFTIGQEIADAVTQANPKPVKLKFEKVWLP